VEVKLTRSRCRISEEANGTGFGRSLRRMDDSIASPDTPRSYRAGWVQRKYGRDLEKETWTARLKFTDDLRTILRQFSDLRQSYDLS